MSNICVRCEVRSINLCTDRHIGSTVAIVDRKFVHISLCKMQFTSLAVYLPTVTQRPLFLNLLEQEPASETHPIVKRSRL